MKTSMLFLFVFCWMFFASTVSAQPALQTTSVRCTDGSYPVTVAINEVFAGAGNGEVLALVTSQRIRIFGWYLQSTVDTTFRLTYGTGADCVTGTTNLTGNFSPFTSINRPFAHPTLAAPLVVSAVSQALCFNAGAACTISGWISACQEP